MKYKDPISVLLTLNPEDPMWSNMDSSIQHEPTKGLATWLLCAYYEKFVVKNKADIRSPMQSSIVWVAPNKIQFKTALYITLPKEYYEAEAVADLSVGVNYVTTTRGSMRKTLAASHLEGCMQTFAFIGSLLDFAYASSTFNNPKTWGRFEFTPPESRKKACKLLWEFQTVDDKLSVAFAEEFRNVEIAMWKHLPLTGVV
jgi:hypothetical protein